MPSRQTSKSSNRYRSKFAIRKWPPSIQHLEHLQQLELDLYWAALPFFGLEERLRLEAEDARDELGGDRFDLGVQVAHRAVVKAARGLELVLGGRELALEIEEVYVRLEVRVVLRAGEKRLQ